MDIKIFQDIIDNSNYIVFFGGAGVSTESGIPDFRSVDGLYSLKYDYPPEMMLSRTFFNEKTEDFYSFYKDKVIHLDAKPNITHNILTKLEKKGKLKAVVTQNIDGLHQLSGSEKTYELHGSIHRNYCVKCNKFYDVDYIKNSVSIPICQCSGIIKPDVVLYEEGLNSDTVQNSIYHISKADTLIIGGTSLIVYPASSLIDYFNGENLILINKEKTPRDSMATHVYHENLSDVFSELIL